MYLNHKWGLDANMNKQQQQQKLNFTYIIASIVYITKKLETFSVDNGWAGFIVFLFRDPHLLEGGQRGQDGTTDPDRVFSFWWGDDLDFDGGWGQSSDFFLHTIGNTWVHCCTTRQDSVGEQIFTDINVAFHD
ncbi:hypothetical protein DERF_014930 [Dermatophagoides farinae]|uniref:Uncharacterized protein n=1 Tax=Dermatophagoides farinae TaxID=6954 RepID=A0A922HNA7_DERFA|nr:hypothetical protein DERF_014930 [Dermatophagoides farinae]